MIDVLIAGAGPAGAVTACLLARAGARVMIVDRDAFPRHKLCGDTLNPGALDRLAALDLGGGPVARGVALRGMRVSGPGSEVTAVYGGDVVGRAVRRRELDAWLLDRAIAAGARFEPGLIARDALVDDAGGRPFVRGLRLHRRDDGGAHRLPALMTIAADGRRSAVARSVGLTRSPVAPRRWAWGSYATGIAGAGALGEMHLRRGYYLGIAPLGEDLCNVCVVTSEPVTGLAPMAVIARAIAADPALADRFAGARFVEPVTVLGPLAADVRAQGVRGLLLAGDAAGFVDPMTGDGLHLALRSAEIVAAAARLAIEHGRYALALEMAERERRRLLGGKLRFNRTLRRLSGSPRALGLAARGAHVLPGAIRRVVRYAGDVP